jgi:hypothetical protein
MNALRFGPSEALSVYPDSVDYPALHALLMHHTFFTFIAR